MEPPKKPVRIAILGAGIGGLALAIGLTKRNISYTIYEATPSFSAIGAGVAFGPNALHAMEKIDPEFRAKYDKIATGNITPGKEHVFHDILLNEEVFGNRQGWEGASVEYECYSKSSAHRKDLLHVMTSLVPTGAVVLGKRAMKIDQYGEKVMIHFADGSLVEADVVIGCDGAKAVSREAVLGQSYPNKVNATYSGRYVYRAVVPMEEAREILGEYAGDGKMFVGPGKYIASYQMSGGTELNMLAGRQDEKPWTYDQWTHEVSKEEMLGDFDGCDSRLVNLLEWAKPIKWSLHHHLDTPAYYNKRVVLLGDAAHASTPHQGAGAGQCLEDALILSHLLSLALTPASNLSYYNSCNPSLNSGPFLPSSPISVSSNLLTAFQVYNSICRPRAQQMVRTSDEAGKMYCFADPECVGDVRKIVQNARERFRWIWDWNADEALRKAGEEFGKLRREGGRVNR